MSGYYKSCKSNNAFLVGFCFAFLSFSPLVFADTLSLDLASDGRFTSNSGSVSVPPGVSYSGSSSGAVSSGSSGGLSQSISTNYSVDGKNITIPSSVSFGLEALRAAGASCFTGKNCNLDEASNGQGLQALMESQGWSISDGLLRSRVNGFVSPETHPYEFDSRSGVRTTTFFGGQDGAVDKLDEMLSLNRYIVKLFIEPQNHRPSTISYCSRFRYPSDPNHFPLIGSDASSCYYGARYDPTPPLENSVEDYIGVPLVDQVIIDAFSDMFSPFPSDFDWLSDGIDLSAPDVELFIEGEASVEGEKTVTTKYDSEGGVLGLTESVKTTTLSPDPSTNPSKKPNLNSTASTTTTEYGVGGNVVGSETTVIEGKGQGSSSGSGGSGGSGDSSGSTGFLGCESFQYLCDFLDWFREPFDDPEPDLSELLVRDISGEIMLSDYTVGSSNSSCPSPYVIPLSIFSNPVEISYQPFCDLGNNIRFLVLALAYLSGAVLLVRSV